MTPDRLSEAIAHQNAGRLVEAAAQLRRHLLRCPDDKAATERLAFIEHALGDLPAAASTFETLCRLWPESAAAQSNLATIRGKMGRFGDAIWHYERALMLDSRFEDARFNLAQIHEMRGQTGLAIAEYREVVTQNSRNMIAWYRLGYSLFASGFRDDAQEAYRHALDADPNYVEARWALTMSTLPLAYDIGESPDEFRNEFSNQLDRLNEWFVAEREALGYRVVGNQQPYYIMYHDRNNREILSRYGDLCSRLMQSWYSQRLEQSAPKRPGPINLVIISGNVHDHAVWTALVRGWCRHINKARFRITILYTDSVVDNETDKARVSVETFIGGTKELTEWVDLIRDIRPDVLIYPEVGMDKTCIKLAALRLAPVQAVAWGNPETTGLPTIDYFFSAEAFEPTQAQENYREKVILLAGIGSLYEALNPDRIDLDIASLGLDPARPILLCPATPYKFLPEHDWTFAAIAAALPGCQIVFVTDDIAPYLSTQLDRRLRSEFDRIEADYSSCIRFIPRLSRSEYFSLMRQSTVYLDTIVFSGFNTAMQAFECGLPVVTVEGRFLRSRFASGLLRTMGVDEMVATDPHDYVMRTVTLVLDSAKMAAVRRKIVERFPLLLVQQESIRSLESFLEAAVYSDGTGHETSLVGRFRRLFR